MAIIDARDLPEGSAIEADLVIIGGGMAGIAIATEWGGANKQVAVLESGDRDISQTNQDLYRGSAVMRAPDYADTPIDDYLWQSRIRALGGSGHVWGGKCAPLDDADFMRREWLERTGWPLTRAELMPFYNRACRLLQIPLFDRSFDEPHEEGRPPWVIDGAREFFSSPRYFSPVSGGADRAKFDQFRTAFAEAPNIDVYLNANVMRINQHRRRRAVSELEIQCLNGRRHRARGRSYVLATGGIENVRMLLTSQLGNESGLLGRFFMGHFSYDQSEDNKPISMLAVSDAAQSLGLYTDNARDRFHCVIGATLEAQRRFNIGNFTATLTRADVPASPEGECIRKLAAVLDGNQIAAAPAQQAPAYFMAEHMPNPDSRITIDPASVDALGVPRVRLEWVYTQRDLDNVERGIAAMATVLGETRSGRMCWPLPRNELLAGFSPSRHHMGATRMSVDAGEGVVDPQCRLHEINNLYVAGCSVFPTSAIANPTLTIIALAVRMSDHLKHELGVRA